MLRPTTAAVTLIALTGVGVGAQTAPSLAGQWELVAASGLKPGDQPADGLTIREIRATTTAAGAAMPPALRALQIERRTGAATATTTMDVGLEGGHTGGSVGGPVGGPGTGAQSQWSTRWVETHLIAWHLERTTTADHTVEVETTEEWSINEAGHLVIETRVRQTGHQPVNSVVSYRRH